MKNLKALVLVSGGLDSVYNLFIACNQWPQGVGALFFNYGQKAWRSEKKAVLFFAEKCQIPLEIVNLSSLFSQDSSALISSRSLPKKEVDLEDHSSVKKSAGTVWVSNRNGIFLNVAALKAENYHIPLIIPGFNREEALTFSDNSREYMEKLNECLKLSTSNGVQVYSFSIDMDKSRIFEKSLQMGIDMERLWPCYDSGSRICRLCESCKRFLRAKSEVEKRLK